jgi:hypothetical protein
VKINKNILEAEIKKGLEAKLRGFLSEQEFAQIELTVDGMTPKFEGPPELVRRVIEGLNEQGEPNL